MHNQLSIPVCQIVGYKRAGKTTLMTSLIRYFSNTGMRVGTLKHHGHGGEPAIIKETDSYQHTEAGSLISAVQGEKQLHLTVNEKEKLTLTDILPLYTFLPLDLLLIEGCKNASYPKIVLIREEADIHLLDRLSNVIAVGSWNMNNLHIKDHFTFSLQEMETSLPQLAKLMIGD